MTLNKSGRTKEDRKRI